MGIRICSFGIKHGIPRVFTRAVDCRRMANPHNFPQLKHLNGLDADVRDFVRGSAYAVELHDRMVNRVVDGGVYAFYCVGGKHRSVAMAEWVAETLRRKGLTVDVQHYNL